MMQIDHIGVLRLVRLRDPKAIAILFTGEDMLVGPGDDALVGGAGADQLLGGDDINTTTYDRQEHRCSIRLPDIVGIGVKQRVVVIESD